MFRKIHKKKEERGKKERKKKDLFVFNFNGVPIVAFYIFVCLLV